MTNNWDANFWRARRVMVTGGNGFLGKNVVRKLYERGANVFVADLDPSATLRVDLRHLEDIRRALKDAKPQMVTGKILRPEGAV